jgi:hypothetical protein
MGNASPEGILNGAGNAFVNAAMKATLAENGVPFAVVAATAKRRNSFGDDECVFSIAVSEKAAAKVAELDAGMFDLCLSHNDVRERQAGDFAAALAQPGVETVGPCYLVQVTTKSGQKAWSLSTEPDTSPVEQAAAQAPAADDDDDGIPY